MLNLPSVSSMTLARADEFLHSHHPDIADAVDDYELRGGTHFYFLDDGAVVKINKRKAVFIDAKGTSNCDLAFFNLQQ